MPEKADRARRRERAPKTAVESIPGASMTVRATGYGPGLAWTSHLRVGRREVTNWYDSPGGKLRETDESVVTRKVRLLGRDCFEVRARSRKAGETGPHEETAEYFFVDDAGTHWIRPKGEGRPDLADAGAWEMQDEEEGVSPVEISTERPEADSTLEVVDLTLDGETVRCLRETFYEVEQGKVRYGGDVFRRDDGTSILYHRLLAEGMRGYDALAGAPEYELGGTTLRVWETVWLVEEGVTDKLR